MCSLYALGLAKISPPRQTKIMKNKEQTVTWSENDLPYSQLFGDHYYSRNDGRLECRHVFLQGNDLPARWSDTETFTIGELGFGTGLNFLETWAAWKAHRSAGQSKEGQKLIFASVEGFLMQREEAQRALSLWPDLAELTDQILGQWDNLSKGPVRMDDQTELHVIMQPVETALDAFPNGVDAWFLDGFSPAKNPDMWSPEVLGKVCDKTRQGGTCSSYTSAGWVRRNLQDAGFDIEKRQGFGSKRDMIVGLKT